MSLHDLMQTPSSNSYADDNIRNCSLRTFTTTTSSGKIAISKPPTVTDILCGKDKTYARREGNQRFREIIQEYVVPYKAATTKQEKMQYTKEIVRYLQTEWSARFLKMVGEEWQEISSQDARDKTSHALRFAAAQCSRSKSYSYSTIISSYKPRRSNHRRNISADSCTNHSSNDSSCNGNVAIYQEAFKKEVTVVQTMLDRQQAFFKQLRTDFECDDKVQGIIPERIHSASVTMTSEISVPSVTAAPEEREDEFNTLRSEDFDGLFDEPLVDGEWDNGMDLDLAR
jgi:hypothetical protein